MTAEIVVTDETVVMNVDVMTVVTVVTVVWL